MRDIIKDKDSINLKVSYILGLESTIRIHEQNIEAMLFNVEKKYADLVKNNINLKVGERVRVKKYKCYDKQEYAHISKIKVHIDTSKKVNIIISLNKTTKSNKMSEYPYYIRESVFSPDDIELIEE